ncbi:MAG: hypothetical protein A2821_02890 [Candidatus Magasanikbacteria bacterium RIFCSPHIGHO2_01_FULL_41_23]|uniref:Uncharacterized protein n=1 Tax=Candidatus Magasanikbacteria bacterium RIFCSPLOWO2_01_FULL_40_15 TaxID=1798686 RepID=A0A1F6N3E2_9BACT|nr:MAG: hypothetical protein A2821_02890 [Candidatus Magasanikbacteria bacterium RIFCSPHIGHO2_01_FULL_41_23]OGH67284.1 MAG: hypothetical protein A3C66_00905 [Candidatus Magasanikbacteria bacterium RIFCSPHIGHO2_02_FULL_41_35]OGH76509.1 MAG: hypothetical protein A3F22_00115 [Candidatus Magasanikbacteria bacterium RIFCSPHIGHO2_12_FULL_41_16]OGH78505.1 MAG: hypothetical protein A2983_03240 [Candidatus Magasanikbacteria bacterium RIFCSPLOWO2_01_FULL_40_15]
MEKKWVVILLGIAFLLFGLGSWYFLYIQKSDDISVNEDPLADIKIPNADATTKKIYEEKISATKEMYLKMPDIWETWVAIGNLKSLFGDYVGALAAYEQSVAIQPNNIVAQRNIAVLYAENLQDYKQAEAHYRLAIRNELNRAELYMDLIKIQWKKLNNENAAKITLEEGLKRTKNDYDLVYFAIAFYTEIGDKETADSYQKKLETISRPTTPQPSLLVVPNQKQ